MLALKDSLLLPARAHPALACVLASLHGMLDPTWMTLHVFMAWLVCLPQLRNWHLDVP